MRIHNGDFVKIHRTREPFWLRANPDAHHIPSMTLRDLLNLQGIPRQRRNEVGNYHVNAGCITAAVGGYSIVREAIL